MPSDSESKLITRAFTAFRRACAGQTAMQPSNSSGLATVADKTYVALRNVNGVLAAYRVRNDGALKRLKRWPAELDAQ